MKLSKIEKYEVIEIVRAGIRAEKSSRDIAADCNDELRRRGIDDTISHKAVNDYTKLLKESDRHVRRDVIQRNRSVQLKLIKTDLDIIQTTTRTTTALLERFDYLDSLPNQVEARIVELGHLGDDPDEWDTWKSAFLEAVKINIGGLAVLNREVRENVKFLADLRAKAYDYNLSKDFVDCFMEAFQRASPEAYEQALAEVATNARLQKIVEHQLRGMG